MKVETLIREAVHGLGPTGNKVRLAEMLGVSPGNVTDWVHGRRHCPDKHVLAMAKIAGRDPMTTALEVYKERLGEVLRTCIAGAVAMLLCFGGSDFARAAASTGDGPMRADV